ncbi:MAG: toll/interleukin-1 receptor domain-containing protein, partial [Bacteroidota bacterium]|nr:toll/interleukin-1 receptor domain-containing protein [Bacteroidota bacterium]MDX5429580.1 toll/interleukin-1 receptor domain-containing protein [Bacteroidota bacterium]MDX5468364.1 toll/interleukin-1 receptor domain-containing protein [Bacteroidota bacterium]
MLRLFKPYDVFISYVVEDRATVEQLNAELRKQGLRVWYAKEQLFPGAEIRKLIHHGLSQSRFGIALISPAYGSQGALGELFYLMRDKEVVIPVLHGTTVEELAIQHPELITRYCLNTQEGIKHVAEKTAAYIRQRSSFWQWIKKHAPTGRKSMLLFSLMTALLCGLLFFLNPFSGQSPPEEQVREEVETRIAELENLIHEEIKQDSQAQEAILMEFKILESSMEKCINDSSTERNPFHFYDGRTKIHTQKELRELGIVPNTKKISAPFGLKTFSTWRFKHPEQ